MAGCSSHHYQAQLQSQDRPVRKNLEASTLYLYLPNTLNFRPAEMEEKMENEMDSDWYCGVGFFWIIGCLSLQIRSLLFLSLQMLQKHVRKL